MRDLISNFYNAPKTSEMECVRGAGKVLTTHDTRRQSPQNIYNLLYDIHKLTIEKPIIFPR
jgi:hypothetical protein